MPPPASRANLDCLLNLVTLSEVDHYERQHNMTPLPYFLDRTADAEYRLELKTVEGAFTDAYKHTQWSALL